MIHILEEGLANWTVSESGPKRLTEIFMTFMKLVGGLVAMNFIFPFSWVAFIIPIDELIYIPPTSWVIQWRRSATSQKPRRSKAVLFGRLEGDPDVSGLVTWFSQRDICWETRALLNGGSKSVMENSWAWKVCKRRNRINSYYFVLGDLAGVPRLAAEHKTWGYDMGSGDKEIKENPKRCVENLSPLILNTPWMGANMCKSLTRPNSVFFGEGSDWPRQRSSMPSWAGSIPGPSTTSDPNCLRVSHLPKVGNTALESLSG